MKAKIVSATVVLLIIAVRVLFFDLNESAETAGNIGDGRVEVLTVIAHLDATNIRDVDVRGDFEQGSSTGLASKRDLALINAQRNTGLSLEELR